MNRDAISRRIYKQAQNACEVLQPRQSRELEIASISYRAFDSGICNYQRRAKDSERWYEHAVVRRTRFMFVIRVTRLA